MKLGTFKYLAIVLLQSIAVSAPTAQAAGITSIIGAPAAAQFEGATIDLSKGWGEAKACVELGSRTSCYRSEKELLASVTVTVGTALAAATCASSLRLYRLSGLTGGVLLLTSRGVVINLAAYGFDNDTSSYTVGACSASFFSGASGSGSVYPGSTSPGSSATAMASGWENVVSSVFIS